MITLAELHAMENSKTREELFANPYFPKEFRLDFTNFSNEHGIYKKEGFIDHFWESEYLEAFNVNLLRELVEQGFIDLSVELIVKWQHEIQQIRRGESVFTCDDDVSIRKILHQEDETLGMEVEDEIWRSGERAEENDPEITIYKVVACFKFEMPSNDQVEAA